MPARGPVAALLRLVAVIGIVTGGLASTSAVAAAATPAPPAAASSGNSRLIVKVAGGLSAAQRQDVARRNGGQLTSTLPALNLLTVTVPAGEAASYTKRYQADRQVTRVDADRTRKAAAAPSDPAYADQWALPKIGWEGARDKFTPAGSATIAVLDTGVAPVADLNGRLVPGYTAFPNTDPQVDANGHGTALATIAAAATDNSVAIAGVGYAAGVKVMPVRVLDDSGLGQDSDVIAGVVHAADNGAKVILMGFSAPEFSQSLQDAVEYAWSKGAVLVAATGNASSSNPTYPAGDAKVVGVSATDQADALWSGSNYGAAAFLAAPGVDVAAITPGGGTTSITGTSAAAAVTAGAAALLAANDPNASNGVIVGRLARNADAAGTAEQTGNGRVNLGRAVTDTSTEAVVPAGPAPLGEGGPFVGPYTAAAVVATAFASPQALPRGRTTSFILQVHNETTASEVIRSVRIERPSNAWTITSCHGVTAGSSGGNATTGWAITTEAGRCTGESQSGIAPGNSKGFEIFVTTAAGDTDISGTWSAAVKTSDTWGTGQGIAASSWGEPGRLTTTAHVFEVLDAVVATSAATIAGPCPAANKSATAGSTRVIVVCGRNNHTGVMTPAAANSSLTGNFIGTAGTFATGAVAGSTAAAGVVLANYTGTTITSAAGSGKHVYVQLGAPAPGAATATSPRRLFLDYAAVAANNASISGTVYNDLNGSGTFQTGEPGLSGVTVTLGSGAGAPTTTTDAIGAYSFSGLAAGTYSVDYSLPTGFAATSTKPISVPVTAGQSSTGNNFFAQQRNASVSGTLYNDANGNGTLQTGESGLAGVPVSLNGGTPVNTDANGSYSFPGLAAGTYSVDYTLPAGYAATSTKPLSVTVTVGGSAPGNNFFARRTTSTGLVLTSGTNPSTYGDSVTFTATVTSAAGNPNNVGTVTFKNGTDVLCIVALSGNTAECGRSLLPVLPVPYSITAEYSGTSDAGGYSGSTSPVLNHTVAKAGSLVTVTCPAEVTYTGGAHTPCSAKATGAGMADVNDLSVSYVDNTNFGTATATASWAGDGNHTGSTGSATFAIAKAGSTVTVTCPTTDQTYTGSALTPCSAELTGAGLTPSALAVTYAANTNVGTATASASWAGDGNHNGSTGSASFAIVKANTSLAVDPKSSTYSEQASHVTLTATVSSATAPVSAGTVTFTVKNGGGTVIGSATESGPVGNSGQASFNYGLPAGVPAGSYTIHATYNPGSNFNTSSGSNGLTVDRRPTTTSGQTATATFGDAAVTLNATVAGTPPGSSTVNAGTVTFSVRDGGGTAIRSAVASDTVSVSNGGAIVNYALPNGLAAGDYTIETTYNPSSNFLTSAGSSTLTIARRGTAVEVSASPNPIQYSDPTTLTARITPATAGGEVVTGSVQFWVNGTSVGTAAVSVSNGTATASFGHTLSRPVGSYPLRAVFTSSNANFAGSNTDTQSPAPTLQVVHEVMNLEYTGQTFVATNKVGGTATLNVSARVVEDQAGSLGTIPWNNTAINLRVKFTIFTTSKDSPTVTPCTVNVSQGSGGTGTAGCSFSGLKENVYSVYAELIPNSYYAAEGETVAVNVVDPGTGFTTGGGWINDPNTGQRSNFGLTARFLKNGTVQGNSLFIYRKVVNLNAMGVTTAPNDVRAYNFQVKSNAMEGLQQKCTTDLGAEPCWSTITGRSNVKAIDRATGVEYTLGADIIGNQQYFQVDLTDNGEPGTATSPDGYAIRVWTSAGTFYQVGTSRTTFSPTPDGTQVALAGGNVQVRLKR